MTGGTARTVAGAALVFGALTCLALLSPGGMQEGALVLTRPLPGPVAVTAAPFEGWSVRRDGCTFGAGDDPAVIEGDALADTVPTEISASGRLAWYEVTCGGRGRDRFARAFDPDLEGLSDRVEVARLHATTGELEARIREYLPPVLNEKLADYLVELEAKTGGGIRFGDGSFVRVTDTDLSMVGDQLRLDLEVVAHLEVQPLGLRRAGFHLDERFEQVHTVLFLHDWPHVGMGPLVLGQPTACDDESGWQREMCNGAQKVYYPLLQAWLHKHVAEEVTRFAESMSMDQLVGKALTRWAQGVDLDFHFETFLADSGMDVVRLSEADLDSTHVSLSLEVDRAWLGHAAPRRIDIEDTAEAPIDLAISTALLDRVMQAVFDRPIGEVLDDLRGLGESLEADGSFDALAKRFTVAEAGRRSPIEALLWMAELQFDRRAHLVPRLDTVHPPDADRSEDQRLVLYTHDARLMVSDAYPVQVGLTAEAVVDVVAGDDGWTLEIDRDHLLRHMALEQVATGPHPLERDVAYQYAALALFLRDQTDRIGGFTGEQPLMDDDAVAALFDLAPTIPRHVESEAFEVELADLAVDGVQQALIIRGDVRSK